jgi:hypothetical protein
MAKGRQKKPKKGIRYIAQKLRKYYPKRYKNFNEALLKSRVIFDELSKRTDEKSKRVNLRNIFSVERIPKKPKDEEPDIPSGFYESKYFFDIGNEFDLIYRQLPENVFIESKVSKSNLPQLKGDEDNETKIQTEFQADPYELYFKDFVDYGNKMLELGQGDYNENSLYYTYTKPIRKNGKWVMYIISSDDEGIQCDYGFDPDDFSLPDQFVECPKDYEDMPYNVLRREARQQGIKFKKSPTKKDLISELKKQSKPEKPTAEKPKKNKKSLDVDSEKEKTKRIEAEAKKLDAENKKRELDLREQELDMEKIQYGLMSVDEFKKKWGKK